MHFYFIFIASPLVIYGDFALVLDLAPENDYIKWLQNQADLMAETMILSQKLEDNQTLAIYFFVKSLFCFTRI